jgi:PDZ domain-containing protein
MVPAPGASPSEAGRQRSGVAWRLALAVAVLLIAFVVGAAFMPVPYVTLRPGKARPVTQQVVVQGAPSYPPEESIAYTTVGVGQATLLEAFVGWLDDDVDVRPEEAIRGERSPEENRRYNAQLMDTSKLLAITVALRHLGHDVTIRTSGTVVRQIAEGSPAAGVLELDDVIIGVDDQAVDKADEIGELLQVGGPGATHLLTVERPAGSDQQVQLEIVTVAAPDDPQRAIIGIAPEDRVIDFELPIEVVIDSGDVGGPSAGLAFTLAVLDVLTPGELTGGHRVAVTGTISLDGSVGPVGGPAQKAVTVRDAGYEVFLVPSPEEDEVRAAVGESLQVIAVDTLGEALEALGSLGGNAGSLVG